VGAVLALVVIALAFLFFWGGPFIRDSVNKFGPRILGVPVTLKDAEFRPVRGIIRLSGLKIGNPKGFKTDSLMEMGTIEVSLRPLSLFTDTIEIRKILIEDPKITYERGLKKSNFEVLLDPLSSPDNTVQPSAGAKPEAPAKKPGKKVVIDELTVSGGRVNVSLTAMQGASAPIALATLTMRDVGREGEAMRLGTGQMTQWVLGTIFKSVLAAVGGIGGSAVEGVKGAEKATVETVRKLGGKLGIGGSPQEPEKR
jgi:hypothetical protein